MPQASCRFSCASAALKGASFSFSATFTARMSSEPGKAMSSMVLRIKEWHRGEGRPPGGQHGLALKRAGRFTPNEIVNGPHHSVMPSLQASAKLLAAAGRGTSCLHELYANCNRWEL